MTHRDSPGPVVPAAGGGAGLERAARLARVDADIDEAERKVTEQALRYEMMEFDGQDTRQAMRLLKTFEAIYVELVRFRQTLRERVGETASPGTAAPPEAPRRP